VDDDVSVGVVDVGGIVDIDIGGDADGAHDAVASARVDVELSSAGDAEMSTSPYMSVRCTEDRTADAYDADDDIDDDDGAGGVEFVTASSTSTDSIATRDWMLEQE